MNDVYQAVDALEQLAKDLNATTSKAEAASYFSAARWLLSDLEAFVYEDKNEDDFLLNKLAEIQWRFGALAGFDAANGQSKSQHCDGVIGALGNFASYLDR